MGTIETSLDPAGKFLSPVLAWFTGHWSPSTPILLPPMVVLVPLSLFLRPGDLQAAGRKAVDLHPKGWKDIFGYT